LCCSLVNGVVLVCKCVLPPGDNPIAVNKYYYYYYYYSILDVSGTGYESDFMSSVRLEYDCCEEMSAKINISTIRLNNSFKHIVSHLDDLKIASHRISEVENMIKEQECKRLHASSHNTYSVLVCLFSINCLLHTVQAI